MAWMDSWIDQLWQAWAYVNTGRTLAVIIGVGFALLAVFLLFATRTRWGKTKPLTKCIVLSILAHVWLLMYGLGHRQVLPQGDPNGRADGMMMAFEPFDEPAVDESVPQDLAFEDVPQPGAIPLPELPALTLLDRPESPEETILPSEGDSAIEPLNELAVLPLPASEEMADSQATPILPSDLAEFSDPSPPEEPILPPIEPTALPNPETIVEEQSVHGPGQLAGLASRSSAAPSVLPPDLSRQIPMPEEYRLRQMSNRLEIARTFGADEDSEAAVDAALAWLAQAQSADGSWNAARFGGGTETRALGEYRYGTGDRADTGVSGLALLAFLSAGHTHLDGKHRDTVTRGLSYLLQVQMPSGDLSGPKMIGNENAVVNARMYCHSIALLALAEAHAMTHDPVLRKALLQSAQYTINAQDPRGGGWRYHPGEPGDLSLFGWKAMALTSVTRSGIEVPELVHSRMKIFLDSCMTGRGGLARYRPREGAPSETMTAEALACRLLLHYQLKPEARHEATEMIMNNLPGNGPDNVYYWYYATLALFQLQDENWRRWNQALKSRLLDTQQPGYRSEAGSWDPDGMWGGYGGRVYSTAMSCLCLEVYYRYLPLYR